MTTENRLLSVLPQVLYEKLAPTLKRWLQRGDRLHEPGEQRMAGWLLEVHDRLEGGET